MYTKIILKWESEFRSDNLGTLIIKRAPLKKTSSINSYSIHFAQPSSRLFVFIHLTVKTYLQILYSFLGMIIDDRTSGITAVTLNASWGRRRLTVPFLDTNIYMIVNLLRTGTQEPVASLAETLAIYIYIPTIFIGVLYKEGNRESGRFINI
jgi:hypothetical protein